MRFDQLDPVAEWILHVPAVPAFNRLVFLLGLLAGAPRFFAKVPQAVDG